VLQDLHAAQAAMGARLEQLSAAAAAARAGGGGSAGALGGEPAASG
jgi:hypothetical protein